MRYRADELAVLCNRATAHECSQEGIIGIHRNFDFKRSFAVEFKTQSLFSNSDRYFSTISITFSEAAFAFNANSL